MTDRPPLPPFTREASINDLVIHEADRRIHGPRSAGHDDDELPLR